MKNILLITIFLTTNICYSQIESFEDINLRKKNNIKSTKIYQIDSKDSLKNKYLSTTQNSDKEGRIIETKRYSKNGKLIEFIKFNYKNESRIMILFDSNGKETRRFEHNFPNNKKDEKAQSFFSNNIKAKFYKKKNMRRIWGYKKNSKKLLAEYFYNNDKQLIKINTFDYHPTQGTIKNTRIIERNKDGSPIKIINTTNDEIRFLEIYEYEKYST